MWKPRVSTGVGFSEKAVWSRAARRHASKAQEETEQDDEDIEMALGFKIRLEEIEGGQIGTRVMIRWLKGYDSVLFESFCGMVKRKLEESMR
jgi:23S rRNA (adenine1618-N6)-methyltransferase